MSVQFRPFTPRRDRGGAVLVALIRRRSQVQILLPLPISPISLTGKRQAYILVMAVRFCHRVPTNLYKSLGYRYTRGMPYKDPVKQREYLRKRYARRRSEWLKHNGPCKNCGDWKNLEVDHINPKEKVSHSVWSWSEERMLNELAKCQVLCHDCHVQKTWEGRRLCHGNYSKYKKGCRCIPCRDAHTIYKRLYRKRKKQASLAQLG